MLAVSARESIIKTMATQWHASNGTSSVQIHMYLFRQCSLAFRRLSLFCVLSIKPGMCLSLPSIMRLISHFLECLFSPPPQLIFLSFSNFQVLPFCLSFLNLTQLLYFYRLRFGLFVWWFVIISKTGSNLFWFISMHQGMKASGQSSLCTSSTEPPASFCFTLVDLRWVED